MPTNEAMAVKGLARLEGQCMVERWGLRTWHVGKRGLQHWSEKKQKKEEKKHIFTYVPANEAMVAAGLARLEGRCMVERWRFEDWEKGSLQWSEKKRKRRKKKHNFTCMPMNAGNGGSGCGG